MRKTSRAALRAYLLAAVLTLASMGVWTALLAGGEGQSVGSSVACLIILVTSLLIGVGWLLAGRLRLSGRAHEIPTRIADLAVIDGLNQAADRGDDRDRLLVRLAEGARAAFSSRGAHVYLLDDAQECLVLLSNPTALRITGITFPRRFGKPRIRLAGSTWYSGALQATQPVVTSWFDDIVAITAELEGSEAYRAILPTVLRAQRVLSVMTVPIRSGDRVLGVVDMSRGWPFTDEEAERFRVISEEVAVVLSRIDAEKRLSKSEDLYRMLTKLTPDLVFVADGSLRVVLANSAAAHFVGRSSEQLKGARVAELFGPLGTLFEDRLSQAAATSRSLEFEDRLTVGESEVWLKTYLVPLPAGARGLVLGVSRDVARRHRLQTS